MVSGKPTPKDIWNCWTYNNDTFNSDIYINDTYNDDTFNSDIHSNDTYSNDTANITKGTNCKSRLFLICLSKYPLICKVLSKYPVIGGNFLVKVLVG